MNRNLKVLIIDDDKIICEIYRGKFQSAGFVAEVASDGEVGLALLDTFAPDVILLDLILPRRSGLEVIRAIRATPTRTNLPIVVISNCFLEKPIKEAMAAGATTCLSKSDASPNTVLEIAKGVLLFKSAPPPPRMGQAVAEPWRTNPVPKPGSPVAPNQALEPWQNNFLEQGRCALDHSRRLFETLAREPDTERRLNGLHELQRDTKWLAKHGAVSGFRDVAQLAGALDALVQEMRGRPAQFTPSTIRTVSQGIDALGHLLELCAIRPEGPVAPPPAIMAVDDDTICREMITLALQQAGLRALTLESPATALEVSRENHFDLVFLDVNMPGLTGYELCTHLREQPHHKDITMIFVTSLSDFETRTRSSVLGRCDYIAKPFLLVELAVKALIHLSAKKCADARHAERAVAA